MKKQMLPKMRKHLFLLIEIFQIAIYVKKKLKNDSVKKRKNDLIEIRLFFDC